MPLGILKEDDFIEELVRLKIDRNIESVNNELEVSYVEIKHGRGNKEETSEAKRAEIAEAAINGVDVNIIASEQSISKSSISAYKNGATSTSSYDNPNELLKKANDSVRTSITKSAMGKLTDAIRAIDLSGELKPNIASAVARDMATIVDRMNPSDNGVVVNNKVLIYRPRVKEEDDYDVIEVRD